MPQHCFLVAGGMLLDVRISSGASAFGSPDPVGSLRNSDPQLKNLLPEHQSNRNLSYRCDCVMSISSDRFRA
ncbi:uncharacterized protein METZ01_LOCUS16892 [marine metagenome]|uniref:Uncharacterized protein n=1 Tax=marine metagenome TaxID=408172 RepID=A0A381PCM4_9ZZZZ